MPTMLQCLHWMNNTELGNKITCEVGMNRVDALRLGNLPKSRGCISAWILVENGRLKVLRIPKKKGFSEFLMVPGSSASATQRCGPRESDDCSCFEACLVWPCHLCGQHDVFFVENVTPQWWHFRIKFIGHSIGQHMEST